VYRGLERNSSVEGNVTVRKAHVRDMNQRLSHCGECPGDMEANASYCCDDCYNDRQHHNYLGDGLSTCMGCGNVMMERVARRERTLGSAKFMFDWSITAKGQDANLTLSNGDYAEVIFDDNAVGHEAGIWYGPDPRHGEEPDVVLRGFESLEAAIDWIENILTRRVAKKKIAGQYAGYGWIIDLDLIEDGDDNGQMGPRNMHPAVQQSLMNGGGATFKMLDDDREHYYTGRWIEDAVAIGLMQASDVDDYSSVGDPLEDFGTPNAGCTIMTKGNGQMIIGNLAKTALQPYDSPAPYDENLESYVEIAEDYNSEWKTEADLVEMYDDWFIASAKEAAQLHSLDWPPHTDSPEFQALNFYSSKTAGGGGTSLWDGAGTNDPYDDFGDDEGGIADAKGVGFACRRCNGSGESIGLYGEEPCSGCGGEGFITVGSKQAGAIKEIYTDLEFALLDEAEDRFMKSTEQQGLTAILDEYTDLVDSMLAKGRAIPDIVKELVSIYDTGMTREIW
jgi:hypothetical protein